MSLTRGTTGVPVADASRRSSPESKVADSQAAEIAAAAAAGMTPDRASALARALSNASIRRIVALAEKISAIAGSRNSASIRRLIPKEHGFSRALQHDVQPIRGELLRVVALGDE